MAEKTQEEMDRYSDACAKGGYNAAARAKERRDQDNRLPWPQRSKKSFAELLNGRRFDEAGMVVKFKGDKKRG